MAINQQQLIALLPLSIIGLTILVVMLFIAWHRDHFISAVLTIIGLNITLLSLGIVFYYQKVSSVDVTILLRIDGYFIFYAAIILLCSLASCIFAYSWLISVTDNNREEFYLLILISTLGSIILVSANHFASFFIGIELLSVPMMGLIDYATNKRYSLEAAIKYMILSAATSTFLLFGIALIYADCGNLSFMEIGQYIHNHNILKEPLFLAGLGMIITVLGFKLSLVPFHLWTPDIYQGAPVPVSAFLSTASKIALFCLMIHLFAYIPIDINPKNSIFIILVSLAIFSMIFGNVMALSQNNIKRLLGYSSIAHLGYILLALIILNNKLSIEAAGVYMVGYILSNLGLFGIINIMSSPYRGYDNDYLYMYRGLFWYNPILAALMTIMLLSLAGIPLTVGFIGKLYTLIASINEHLWSLTISIVIGSSISLYYYLRVIIILYLSPPENNMNLDVNSLYTFPGLVVLICATLVMLFGVYPDYILKLLSITIPK